jgi:hypothetical protein
MLVSAFLIRRASGTAVASSLGAKTEAPACHLTGVVPRQTSSANVRSHGVDRARRRNADLSHERQAAIVVAPHSPMLVIDQPGWDQIERRLLFQREARPFR